MASQQQQQQQVNSFESRQFQSSSSAETTQINQSFANQQTSEIYEAAEFGGGVMKGYKPKGAVSLFQNGSSNSATEAATQEQHGQFLRDTGIFGGITGDHNALQAEDEEFDYKKHSVKSLVGHFSKVRPRTEIPVQYLPEQRIYNGDQAPTLNYLAAGLNASSSSTTSRTTSSQQQQQQFSMTRSSEGGNNNVDMEASRREY